MKNTFKTDEIYMELKALGIIDSQISFSKLCGKSTMWYSCIKSRNLPISSSASIHLAMKLKTIARSEICNSRYNKIQTIIDLIISEAEASINWTDDEV
jgi:hypothetical protein